MIVASVVVVNSMVALPYPVHSADASLRFCVREPCASDAREADRLLQEKLLALLGQPSWPRFADGAYLDGRQAERFYRAVQGVQALVHVLERSSHLRGSLRDGLHENGVDASTPRGRGASGGSAHGSARLELHRREWEEDGAAKPAGMLTDLEESRLWAALIELGEELANLADDLHAQQ
jgi:hypothetical protein